MLASSDRKSGMNPSNLPDPLKESEMKKFLLALSLAALTAGFARTSYAQFYEGSCLGNNSKHCVDARNAFAKHHGGVMPGQYYNHWYEGNQGRWNRQNNEW